VEKSIIFDAGCLGSRFKVKYAPYGFNLYMSSARGEKCVCCIGDDKVGCIFGLSKSPGTARFTYCHPYVVPEPLSYPSMKWVKTARELTMTNKTPNGRIIIAKPMVKDDKINGIRFLCSESEEQEAMNFVEVSNNDNSDGASLKIKIKASIINPTIE
jgi:hypothetical protein